MIGAFSMRLLLQAINKLTSVFFFVVHAVKTKVTTNYLLYICLDFKFVKSEIMPIKYLAIILLHALSM